MTDHQNDLFPEEPNEPARVPDDDDILTPEEAAEMEKFLTEADIEDMADEMETTMRDWLSSWCFEVLLTLINPTPESRQKIVRGILTQACKQIEEEVNESAKDVDPEELEAWMDRINTACRRAQERFGRSYAESPWAEEFLERVRQSVRKNLSR